MVLELLVEKTNFDRLLKIESILAEDFKYNLVYPSTLNEMQNALSNIVAKKNKIIMESNFNDYINNKTYNILNLAQEAFNLKIDIEGQNG